MNKKSIVYFFKAIKLFFNNLFSIIISFGKKERFYVIGDSHACAFFLNKYFSVYHIGPITAHNLCKKNSSTDSYNRTMRIIRRLHVNSNVIIIAGEIDCRLHIYNKYMQDKQVNDKQLNFDSFDYLLNNTIHRYLSVIKEIISCGMNVYVLSVAPANTQINKHKYPYYGSVVTQAMIKRRFNELLKERCITEKINYIDLYQHVVKSDGTMIDEYRADEVHLNRKAIKNFVVKQLLNNCH